METEDNNFMKTGAPDDLSPDDRAVIDGVEQAIARVKAAHDGLAPGLRAVKELRLFRRSHRSWAAWCEDLLPFSKRQADRLVFFAHCQAEMGPAGPSTEWAARRLSGVPVERLRDLAAAFAVGGGMSDLDAEDVDRLAREFRGDPPIRMTLTTDKGVVRFDETGVLKELQAMRAAARRITRGGAHLVEDHMTKATEMERAETFRCAQEVVLLAQQILFYYEDRDAPAQEQWAISARGEKRDAVSVIEVFETAGLIR